MTHRPPPPSPPGWLILALAVIALALALVGCSAGDYQPDVPDDAVIVYRCARDNSTSEARRRTSIDVWRAPDGRQWVAYIWGDRVDPIAKDMRPEDACVP